MTAPTPYRSSTPRNTPAADAPPADNLRNSYVGRFAPSPTGPLHFGSLIAALASWLDAHAHKGRWLLRIEDIDPPREQPGAAAAMPNVLAAHGLCPDGELLLQSEQTNRYRIALQRLLESGDAFYCTCSRAELAATGGLHRGRCYDGQSPPDRPHAVRLLVGDAVIGFEDRLQGHQQQRLADVVGDFVLWRKEGLPAYQLAVVVDDAAQRVTDVVRGCDLLDNTARQILLQQRLGLPTPSYAHLPVIVNAAGQKLSKQNLARPLDPARAFDNLRAALVFLGQPSPCVEIDRDGKELHALLKEAAAQWQLQRVPAVLQLDAEVLPADLRGLAG